MKLCQTAFALVICWCVRVQGQSQSCPAECSAWCGNDGLTFSGSNGRIVNVAFGKPASASSGYNDSNGPSAPACIAVNGRTSTIHRSTTQPNTNCIHTDRDDFNASWGVDLIRNYIVTNITIYRRQRQFGRRMAGLSVLVDGQLCYSFPNSSDTAALDKLPARIDLTCSPPLTGREVKLQKHGLDTDGQFHLINICEVQVWACKDGLYGAQCDQTCSGHCKDNVPCDNYYGTCLTGCTAGTHGDDCGEQCGQCADSDTCNTVTGLCPHGCQPGWQGDNCKQGCADGIFGSGCSQRCGQCLNSSVCRHDNGFCEQGCSVGYGGILCDTKYASSEDSQNLAGPIAGAVFGGLCVIALSILIVGIYRRRSQQRSLSTQTVAVQGAAIQSEGSDNLAVISHQMTSSAEAANNNVTGEENHYYDELQTPDDSDRAPYSSPVFVNGNENTNNPHIYANAST
ncbi:uncharacterized protein [Littorina saxatilis]|uniref:uncharacterized protein isoform X2 n=1 Tax=Littorina saxatilis TaxID=31220 RepID=UPI0038B4C062